MERIVLEVDDKIAKAWKTASVNKKKEINLKLNIRLGKELFQYSPDDFLLYLSELRMKMAERGLSQKTLDEILNED
jgi:hypothetical protein